MTTMTTTDADITIMTRESEPLSAWASEAVAQGVGD
jgi:hypothetical protein